MNASSTPIPRGKGELIGGPLCGEVAEFDLTPLPDEVTSLPGMTKGQLGYPKYVAIDFLGERQMYRFFKAVSTYEPPLYRHVSLWGEDF